MRESLPMFSFLVKTEKRVSHPEIGEYTIVRGGRGSSVRLSVHLKRGIRVKIPYHSPFSEGERFVNARVEWIKEALQRQGKRAERYKIQMNPGDEIPITGGVIRFSHGQSSKIKITTTSDGVWTVSYPPDSKVEPIKEAVIKILRKRAKDYLPQRLEYFAGVYGFKYAKVFLKNNSSNWGSCSSKSNINLNIHLMRLPVQVCDYIIIHELCHLKYRNHGEKFHEMVNRLCGGKEKELTRELRKYNPEI
ncbi:MAG: M48 family metallopeptidase [Bacteroidales bacterium]